MKKNQSNIDRAIRIITGLLFATAAYLQGVTWLYLIAAIFLITGITGVCGIYKLLGISTCGTKK